MLTTEEKVRQNAELNKKYPDLHERYIRNVAILEALRKDRRISIPWFITVLVSMAMAIAMVAVCLYLILGYIPFF